MKSSLVKLVVFSFLVGPSLVSIADEAPAPRAQELVLDGFQTSTLNQDLPVSAMAFDQDGNLWLAGRTSLWRWTLHDNHLFRLPIASLTPNTPVKEILCAKSQVYLATDKTLYRLSFGPTKLVRYDFPKYSGGQTMQVSADTQFLWWIHENGVFKLGSDNRLKTELLANVLKSDDKAWFDMGNRQLWFVRRENLLMHDLRIKDAEVKLIHRAQQSFTGLTGANSDVYAHTPFTVLRFDNSLRLVQALPVEGSRKLLLTSIDQGKHAYFFDDNLVEVYDLKKETSERAFLDLNQTKNFAELTHGKNYVALLADGIPRTFQLTPPSKNIAKTEKAPKKG